MTAPTPRPLGPCKCVRCKVSVSRYELWCADCKELGLRLADVIAFPVAGNPADSHCGSSVEEK